VSTNTNAINIIINSLRLKNTCGFDGIETKLLESCMDYFSASLTFWHQNYFFNFSTSCI